MAESLEVAKCLYSSEKHQVRMVSVFILGYIANDSQEAVRLLRAKVSNDPSWQVQEILAQAFNEYCRKVGYENALPVIRDWLKDDNPNVQRAVTEGLRIWNQKDYFKGASRRGHQTALKVERRGQRVPQKVRRQRAQGHLQKRENSSQRGAGDLGFGQPKGETHT